MSIFLHIFLLKHPVVTTLRTSQSGVSGTPTNNNHYSAGDNAEVAILKQQFDQLTLEVSFCTFV